MSSLGNKKRPRNCRSLGFPSWTPCTRRSRRGSQSHPGRSILLSKLLVRSSLSQESEVGLAKIETLQHRRQCATVPSHVAQEGRLLPPGLLGRRAVEVTSREAAVWACSRIACARKLQALSVRVLFPSTPLSHVWCSSLGEDVSWQFRGTGSADMVLVRHGQRLLQSAASKLLMSAEMLQCLVSTSTSVQAVMATSSLAICCACGQAGFGFGCSISVCWQTRH